MGSLTPSGIRKFPKKPMKRGWSAPARHRRRRGAPRIQPARRDGHHAHTSEAGGAVGGERRVLRLRQLGRRDEARHVVRVRHVVHAAQVFRVGAAEERVHVGLADRRHEPKVGDERRAVGHDLVRAVDGDRADRRVAPVASDEEVDLELLHPRVAPRGGLRRLARRHDAPRPPPAPSWLEYESGPTRQPLAACRSVSVSARGLRRPSPLYLTSEISARQWIFAALATSASWHVAVRSRQRPRTPYVSPAAWHTHRPTQSQLPGCITSPSL